jgi:hypothetical protein
MINPTSAPQVANALITLPPADNSGAILCSAIPVPALSILDVPSDITPSDLGIACAERY